MTDQTLISSLFDLQRSFADHREPRELVALALLSQSLDFDGPALSGPALGGSDILETVETFCADGYEEFRDQLVGLLAS